MPIRTVSEANRRDHWAVKAKRVKAQRGSAYGFTRFHVVGNLTGNDTLDIHLVRLSYKTLDTDNLSSALKAIRDGIADALHMDDGDPRLTWTYGQQKAAKPPKTGVNVTISFVEKP